MPADTTSAIHATLIPGDGIGPEITEADQGRLPGPDAGRQAGGNRNTPRRVGSAASSRDERRSLGISRVIRDETVSPWGDETVSPWGMKRCLCL